MNTCRICSSPHLKEYIDFGYQTLSTILFKEPQLSPPRFLMTYDYCPYCNHVQARYAIDPSFFYEEYVRLRSTIIFDYVFELAREIRNRVSKPDELVIEIGSNDGMFLEELRELGFSNLLGIESAKNCIEASVKKGIPTLHGYYSMDIAKKVLQKFGSPIVIIIRHVLEHINDVDTFMKAVLFLMSEQTLLVIEVPDFNWAIRKGDFTSFIDQHINYFTINSITTLLNRFGLQIAYMSVVPHNWSGALLLLCYRGEKNIFPSQFLFKRSAENFTRSMKETTDKLIELKRMGKMAAFGGFCRTINFINYLNLKSSEFSFEFVVDDDSRKHYKYLPGSNLIILAPEEMVKRLISFCVICTINYERRIMSLHKDFMLSGGRFVTLFPFRIVERL